MRRREVGSVGLCDSFLAFDTSLLELPFVVAEVGVIDCKPFTGPTERFAEAPGDGDGCECLIPLAPGWMKVGPERLILGGAVDLVDTVVAMIAK